MNNYPPGVDLEDIGVIGNDDEEEFEFGDNPALWGEAIIWGGIKNVPPLIKNQQ